MRQSIATRLLFIFLPCYSGVTKWSLQVQNSPSGQRSYGVQGMFCNPTPWLPIVDLGVMSGAGVTTLLLRSEWQRQAATRVFSPFWLWMKIKNLLLFFPSFSGSCLSCWSVQSKCYSLGQRLWVVLAREQGKARGRKGTSSCPECSRQTWGRIGGASGGVFALHTLT